MSQRAKPDNQLSFIDREEIIMGLLSKRDWAFTYKEQILPLINPDAFRHLFADQPGRSIKNTKVTVSLLIFMSMERLNWRLTTFMYERRIDWLIATDTLFNFMPIHFTTLFKFYRRLEKDETARILFQDLTYEFIKLCDTSVKIQRTDSFFIHGWLAKLSRYGLFKNTIRLFARQLHKKAPATYEEIKVKLSANYLEKEFDLTEKDPDKVQQRLKEMAYDMYLLMETFTNHEVIKELKSYQTLARVFSQQCTVLKPEEGINGLELKEKPVATEGDHIINSPHNPEAGYIKKVKQECRGDRAFISETCAPENLTQFITDVEVTPIAKGDPQEIEAIQERLEKANMKPEHEYTDAAFNSGQTILDSEKRGTILEGPSATHSQSFEVYRALDRRYDIADFAVKIDKVTKEIRVEACPEEQPVKEQARSKETGKLNVYFDPEICKRCEKKERCPVRIGVTTARMEADEAMYAGARRYHKYMENSEYRKKCAVRAGIEGTISEITRAHGVRKSRHKKRARTKLQLIFAAIACNVKRFIRHGEKYGYLTLETV